MYDCGASIRTVASRFSPPKSSVTFCFASSVLKLIGALTNFESSAVISGSRASFALTVKVAGVARLILTLQGFASALACPGFDSPPAWRAKAADAEANTAKVKTTTMKARRGAYCLSDIEQQTSYPI